MNILKMCFLFEKSKTQNVMYFQPVVWYTMVSEQSVAGQWFLWFIIKEAQEKKMSGTNLELVSGRYTDFGET